MPDSGWPGNASFGWLGSWNLPLQLNDKVLGPFLVYAVTSLVRGIQSVHSFPVRNYVITPGDKGILIFSHISKYFSNV